MRVDILTLFPNLFSGIVSESILRRAIERELILVETINIRDLCSGKSYNVVIRITSEIGIEVMEISSGCSNDNYIFLTL